jgi:hypothetical protein
MGLFIRTIGIKRAQTKIMLTNLAYNMQRLIFHERRLATGWLHPKSGLEAQNNPNRNNINLKCDDRALETQTSARRNQNRRLMEVPRS